MYENAGFAGNKTAGGGANAAPNVPRATELMAKNLEGAIERINAAVGFVRAFSDTHLGERGPSSTTGQPAAPSRSGILGGLQDRTDYIHESLSALESELQRLSQI